MSGRIVISTYVSVDFKEDQIVALIKITYFLPEFQGLSVLLGVVIDIILII